MRRWLLLGFLAACGSDAATGTDPTTAPRVPIDRFSAAAGTLFVRGGSLDLPAAGAPVFFDRDPFLVHGLGPSGEAVTWYNWDARPRSPAPIYVFVHAGRTVPDQLNVVDVIPGDPGYNDLWQEVLVEVPADYVANTITSRAAIEAAGYELTTTPVLVNCPAVPEGSVAHLRRPGDYAELHQGWYRDQVMQYFHFGEKNLAAASGQVPISLIYMSDGADRSHDVLGHLPADPTYSPLRELHLFAAASAVSVTDLTTAMAAPAVAGPTLYVNTPIVELP